MRVPKSGERTSIQWGAYWGEQQPAKRTVQKVMTQWYKKRRKNQAVFVSTCIHMCKRETRCITFISGLPANQCFLKGWQDLLWAEAWWATLNFSKAVLGKGRHYFSLPSIKQNKAICKILQKEGTHKRGNFSSFLSLASAVSLNMKSPFPKTCFKNYFC